MIPSCISITGGFLTAALFLYLNRGIPISLGIEKITYGILKDSFAFQYETLIFEVRL